MTDLPAGLRASDTTKRDATHSCGREPPARCAGPSTGVLVMGASGRKLPEPGSVGGPAGGWGAARAASRWVRISGMTCSVLPIRDCQPHWQLARRWLVLLGAVGLTVTLCPGTCSLIEMVTGRLRSVGDDRTYPVGKPVTNVPGLRQRGARSRSLITARPGPARVSSPPEHAGSRQLHSSAELGCFSVGVSQGGTRHPRLHSPPQPDQDHAGSSQFAWRRRFVEHPAFQTGSTFTRGGAVQRRILVALALVGLVLLVLVSRAGAARPPTRSAPAR